MRHEITPRSGTVELVPTRGGTWAPVRAPRRPVARHGWVWLREVLTPAPAHTYLTPGEPVLLHTRRHWLVPLRTMGKAALMMPLAIGLTLALTFLAPHVWWLQALLWVGTAAHQGYLGYLVVLWRVEQILVTDTRILRISGLLTTRCDDVRLDQITDASIRQTLPGRILGYGAIRIESAGQTREIEHLDFVPHPVALYRALS